MNKVEVIKANVNLIDRKKSTQIDKRLRVAAYCRVSTDSEDQLNSYRSQVQYYTDLISKKSEWVKVGIYADEGITGTQVNKREDFQRLINDCMRGEIDMIITKSISRFLPYKIIFTFAGCLNLTLLILKVSISESKISLLETSPSSNLVIREPISGK